MVPVRRLANVLPPGQRVQGERVGCPISAEMLLHLRLVSMHRLRQRPRLRDAVVVARPRLRGQPEQSVLVGVPQAQQLSQPAGVTAEVTEVDVDLPGGEEAPLSAVTPQDRDDQTDAHPGRPLAGRTLQAKDRRDHLSAIGYRDFDLQMPAIRIAGIALCSRRVVIHGLGPGGQAEPAQVSENARHPLRPLGVRYRTQVEFQLHPERPGGVTRLGR